SEDLNNLNYLQTLPGEFPFVRGNHKEANAWEIRQNVKEQDVKIANATALDALAKGAQSVGLCTKKVEKLSDLETLLKGVDLTKVGIHFTCSHSYALLLDLFMQFLHKNNIDATKVYGSIDFDPFHYALKHGNYYESLASNTAELKTIFEKYAKALPQFRLININAQMLHNAGATATQELGYGLAWANEYLYLLNNAGFAIEDITPRMSINLAAGSNYFMEIAKIRACRLLWATIVTQYAADKKEAARIFIHSTSSTWNKTLYDPFVNMLRTTTETMSSAIGGADSISVLPFDSTFQASDEFSDRIARNQQIILKEESFMDKIADPAAGSYYIENLTESIAQYAWSNFKTIEEMNGFAKAYEAGFIQDQVQASANQRDMDMATRKIFVLGTNQYPNLNETVMDKIHLQKEACTCKTQAHPYKSICVYRGTEAIEALRLETEAFVAKGGVKPKIFLLTYGNLAMRKARAGFATNFYGCAGYEIIDNEGFESVDQGAQVALDAKANIVVLCSSDDEYADLVPQACALLKGKCTLVVAGYPKEQLETYKALGIEDFIHVKSNLLEVLKHTHAALLK
ncbi:MAG: methylmalonyl-CoA mutase family protein, partial [Bacteroidales bacterium]